MRGGTGADKGNDDDVGRGRRVSGAGAVGGAGAAGARETEGVDGTGRGIGGMGGAAGCLRRLRAVVKANARESVICRLSPKRVEERTPRTVK